MSRHGEEVTNLSSLPPGNEYTEETAEELHARALEHIWFHSGYAWQDVVEPGGVIVMDRAERSTLIDVHGNRYTDFASGLWLANIGYGRGEVAAAMAAQASRLHYTRHTFPTEPTIRLAHELSELAPAGLSRVFFTSGGGEANEAAMKMAYQYHRLNGEPGRTRFIGRQHSYHGSSFATMSVGGAATINRSLFEPFFLPQAQLVSAPRQTEPKQDLRAELESAILEAGPDTVAAFIGEPISNSAGVQVPEDDYWPMVRSICDKYGILLICDEVITGFGRTGRMFAVEHWNITPDLITVAKGVTSGYAPLGAVIASPHVFERFKPAPEQAFQHVITFGGHAVSAAAARANLDIIRRESLVQRSAEMGEYLISSLNELLARPTVSAVRGKGLMCALDINTAGIPADERGPFAKHLYGRLMARGVHLSGRPDRILFLPPLIIEAEEIDWMVASLGEELLKAERQFGWWS